jgi:hypothetical protein
MSHNKAKQNRREKRGWTSLPLGLCWRRYTLVNLMTPIQLKNIYLDFIEKLDIPTDLVEIREELEEFIIFNANDFGSVSFTEHDSEILFSTGIPSEYKSAIIFDANLVESKGGMVQVGFTTSGGDAVFIKSDGSIVCINHDYNMEEVFVNSNIKAYFQCVIALLESDDADLRKIDHGLNTHKYNYWYSDRKFQGYNKA